MLLIYFNLTSHNVADETLLIFLYALNLLGDVGNELVYLGALGIKVGDDLLLFGEGRDGYSKLKECICFYDLSKTCIIWSKTFYIINLKVITISVFR